MAPKLMVSDGFGRYAIKNSARRPRPQKKKEKEKEKLTRCFYFSLTKLPVVGLFELSVIDWPHIVKVDYSMPLQRS